MRKRRPPIFRELGRDLANLRRASAERAALARDLALARVARRALLDPPPAGAAARLARAASDALSLAAVGCAAVAFGLVWLALFVLARWP